MLNFRGKEKKEDKIIGGNIVWFIIIDFIIRLIKGIELIGI